MSEPIPADEPWRAIEQERARLAGLDAERAAAAARLAVLERLAERLRSLVRHMVVLQGGVKPKDRRAPGQASPQCRMTRNASWSQPGGTSAKASTTRVWIRCSLPCRFRGRARWCSTRGGCIVSIPGRRRCESSTTWTARYPFFYRMFEKRLRTYRAIGSARGAAPLASASPSTRPGGSPSAAQRAHRPGLAGYSFIAC